MYSPNQQYIAGSIDLSVPHQEGHRVLEIIRRKSCQINQPLVNKGAAKSKQLICSLLHFPVQSDELNSAEESKKFLGLYLITFLPL